MELLRGRCHCGAVQFEVRTALARVVQCNCSICAKKGALNHHVKAEDFNLLAGEEALSLYQFGTRTAKHYFCRYCGIHPFARPRVAPQAYIVNVRCLNGYPQVIEHAERVQFDGQHWEQAARDLAAGLAS